MDKKREFTALEFAKREGKTLDWIYKQCRLGKLPATLRDGRWVIQDCRCGRQIAAERAEQRRDQRGTNPPQMAGAAV
jgi:hypothetical protein